MIGRVDDAEMSRGSGASLYGFCQGLAGAETTSAMPNQFPMAAERQRDCADHHDEQFQHAVIVVGVGAKFNSDEFWRWSAGAASERVLDA
jgi:hypothetical protein